MKKSKYKVAAIQYDSIFANKSGNIKSLLALCIQAAQNGAKLIVLPEMCTTGYCFRNRDEIAELVETIPGYSTGCFEEVCREYACHIVVSLPEIDPETGNHYISAALISPEGYLGKYRKSHLHTTDAKWANNGDMGFPVFETSLGRIAIAICFDLASFETCRLLTLADAEVVCACNHWNEEKGPVPSWISRAFENGIYMVISNRFGIEQGIYFWGSSCVLNPDGTIQNYLPEGDGIVYGNVELKKTHNKKVCGIDKLQDRIMDRYYKLILNTYYDNPLTFNRLYNDRPLPIGGKSVVSALQYSPTKGDVEANMEKISLYARKAALSHTQIMVCPEFALTGTPNSPKEASAYAIVLNDAAVIKKLSGIARQNGLYIVLGLIEKNHVNLYITICIVGPYGLEGSYRKIHKSEHEKSWASSGKNHFQYFDLPFGRVGLLAGEDVLFPESTVCLASDAVDLICICAAITEPKPIALPSSPTHVPGSYPGDDSMHWHLIRNRAVECSTYIAFSNQGGKYMGYSGVFSDWDYPRYEDVVDGQGESLLQLEMDISEENGYAKTLVRRKDWLMTKRLHYLYKKLIVKQSFVVK